MQIAKPDFQDQLVRGLSHRMNNILTLFHGYLGLLLENDNLDPSTQEGLARIKEGARIATDLMDRTNALARPRNIIPRQITIPDFLNQLGPSFEKLADGPGKVTVECEPDMPFAWADQSRLRIALTELVKNACEAIQPAGTVHIRCVSTDTPPAQAVCADEESAPSQWITISVIDDGRGISPDIDEQIYLPFITTKKRDTIAGLGLTVAASCMEQIGGVITHESCPGRTVFRLTVPGLRATSGDFSA